MSIRNLFGKLLVVAVGLFLFTLGTDVHAKKGPGKPAAATEPAALKDPLGIQPKALQWGQSHKEVAKVYYDVIDKDYLPKWETVQPGVQMKDLEAEIEAKKAEIPQSKVDFGDLPTNLDGTPFVNEFTYRNQESMMAIDRKGYKRHLFFIRGKLWKVVDVYAYGEKARFGKTYKSAQEKLEKSLTVPGRLIEAKPEENRLKELDWADAKTHLRLVDWGEKAVALIYEDRDTAGRIAGMRTAKQGNLKEIDPSTKAILR
jgi:hypothetical protein